MKNWHLLIISASVLEVVYERIKKYDTISYILHNLESMTLTHVSYLVICRSFPNRTFSTCNFARNAIIKSCLCAKCCKLALFLFSFLLKSLKFSENCCLLLNFSDSQQSFLATLAISHEFTLIRKNCNLF